MTAPLRGKRRREGPPLPLREGETWVSKKHYSECQCWLCRVLIRAGKKGGKRRIA